MIEEDHVDHISQIIEKSKTFCELNPYPSKTTLLETLLSKGVKEVKSRGKIVNSNMLNVVR